METCVIVHLSNITGVVLYRPPYIYTLIKSAGRPHMSPVEAADDAQPGASAHSSAAMCLCVSQLVQLVSAVDPDEPAEGHHFYFSMVPDRHINPNFTLRDNQGYAQKCISFIRAISDGTRRQLDLWAWRAWSAHVPRPGSVFDGVSGRNRTVDAAGVRAVARSSAVRKSNVADKDVFLHTVDL